MTLLDLNEKGSMETQIVKSPSDMTARLRLAKSRARFFGQVPVESPLRCSPSVRVHLEYSQQRDSESDDVEGCSFQLLQ